MILYTKLETCLPQIKAALEVILDFVIPPRCGGCGAKINKAGNLCGSCWQALPLSTGPACARCDFVFEYSDTDFLPFAPTGSSYASSKALCGECLRRPPAFDWCLTVTRYEEIARELLLRLKHANQPGLGKLLGKIMAQKLVRSGITSHAYCYIPVPLHSSRYKKRGYNQAKLLAQGVIETVGGTLSETCLVRSKATVSQAGLSRKGRKRNLDSAFKVPDKMAAMVKGKRFILVDDVFTTGATLQSAAHCLRRAGALEIGAIAFSRAKGTRA